MKIVLIMSTFQNRKEATDMANLLINKRFASCASIIKIEQSIYMWKGKIARKKEYLLMIKANSNNYKKIENLIIKNHHYTIPEIIVIPIINGYEKYLRWVSEES